MIARFILLLSLLLLHSEFGWGRWFEEGVTAAEELALSCSIAERTFADIFNSPEKQEIFVTCKGGICKFQLTLLSKPMDRINHFKQFSKEGTSFNTSDAFAPLFQNGMLFIAREKEVYTLHLKGYEPRKKLSFLLSEIGNIPPLDLGREGPMGISIIIPTFNRLTECEACVLMLKARIQAPQNQWEVIVVADGCTDGTGTYLQSKFTQKGFENFRVVWTDKEPGTYRNAGWSENAGARAATFSFISFCDSDVYHLTDPVTPTLNRLQQTHTNILVGHFHCIKSPHSSVNCFGKTKQFVSFNGDIGYNPGWFVVRKKIFVDLGGNSERYTKWGAEDSDLIHRLRNYGLSIEKLDEIIYSIADEHEVEHHKVGCKDSLEKLKLMMAESPLYRNQEKPNWGQFLLSPPYPEGTPQFKTGF